MTQYTKEDLALAETYPLISSSRVDVIADWAVKTLGLTESWRAVENEVAEHSELHWANGRVSINIDQLSTPKPTGIALRLGSKATVDLLYEQAKSQGAEFSRPLEMSFVAYGFTVRDPDDNEWWVHVENGVLDELRAQNAT